MNPPPAGTSSLASIRLGQPASRRARWSSFGIAVGIHALIVVVLVAIVPLRANLPFQEQAAVSDRGIEVWLLPPTEPPPPEPAPYVPPAPEGVNAGAGGPIELVQPDLSAVGAPGAGDIVLPPLGGPGSYGETPAERLRPGGFSDPRIWAPVPEEYRTLSPQQQEELAIALRFQAWNDSIAAAAAAEAAMRDWTFTDGDGDRWGVSDGQLHLGGITLPMPFNVQGSAAQRDYMRSFDEMARQGANALIQQSVRERQEAIRARRDAERAQSRSDSASTQPRAR